MIEINRKLLPGWYGIDDLFPEIREFPAVLDIFGTREEVERVLAQRKVHLADISHYMSVDNFDASITVGITHLRGAPAHVLYLDIIHELIHVKQHEQGLDLYDRTVSYVDRKTEIDAYEVTVREARKIGLSDREIFDYLRVEWITREEHERLARRLNVSFGE